MSPVESPSTAELLVSLHELVEALDRRVPHLERVGEAAIASDAARLRANALKRIALLTQPSDAARP